MHDDQHGTAIIATAGLMNALEYISRMKIVVVGAGAAGIASAKMYRLLGTKHAVANATIEDGVAQIDNFDYCKYRAKLATEIGLVLAGPC